MNEAKSPIDDSPESDDQTNQVRLEPSVPCYHSALKFYAWNAWNLMSVMCCRNTSPGCSTLQLLLKYLGHQFSIGINNLYESIWPCCSVLNKTLIISFRTLILTLRIQWFPIPYVERIMIQLKVYQKTYQKTQVQILIQVCLQKRYHAILNNHNIAKLF